MWVGLLTDRINNKLEKRNLINEHALNHEPVPLSLLWFICKHRYTGMHSYRRLSFPILSDAIDLLTIQYY